MHCYILIIKIPPVISDQTAEKGRSDAGSREKEEEALNERVPPLKFSDLALVDLKVCPRGHRTMVIGHRG